MAKKTSEKPKKPAATSLSDFIKKASEPKNDGRCWKAWPPQAIEDIKTILAKNDEGTARVTVDAALAWLESAYGLVVTPSTMRRFAILHLNRRGWSSK